MFSTLRSELRNQWIGALALFLVLAGGGAYAASKIGSEDIRKDAVRAKHIKKEQVRTKHLQNGAVTKAKLAAGVEGLQGNPGPAGPQGEPATRLWAVVDAHPTTPTFRDQSGAIGLQRLSAGFYEVRFNRPISHCSATGSVALGPAPTDPQTTVYAYTNGGLPGGSDDDEVAVGVTTDPTLGVDTAFSVQVFC